MISTLAIVVGWLGFIAAVLELVYGHIAHGLVGVVLSIILLRGKAGVRVPFLILSVWRLVTILVCGLNYRHPILFETFRLLDPHAFPTEFYLGWGIVVLHSIIIILLSIDFSRNKSPKPARAAPQSRNVEPRSQEPVVQRPQDPMVQRPPQDPPKITGARLMDPNTGQMQQIYILQDSSVPYTNPGQPGTLYPVGHIHQPNANPQHHAIHVRTVMNQPPIMHQPVVMVPNHMAHQQQAPQNIMPPQVYQLPSDPPR